MTASLRALLTGIIDYAGMFPPAQLPMDEAIRNYARYRTEPESWMLGRFICPAAKLNELSPYVDELFRHGPPLAISALGRGGNDEGSFFDGLKQDLNDIAIFNEKHNGRVSTDVLETKLPAGLVEVLFAPKHEIDVNVYRESNHMFERIEGLIEQTKIQRPKTFFEPVLVAPGHVKNEKVEIDINDYCKRKKIMVGTTKARPGGIKVRCGGVEPAFPSCDHLSQIVSESTWFPLKFTAGLHHPIRHLNSSANTMMHGFINIFCAGVLASTFKFDANVLQKVLDDEIARHFVFEDSCLRWNDHKVTIPQIETARRNNVISFGSCSFDEPREDLKSLGWL